jgi:hypothetical protein
MPILVPVSIHLCSGVRASLTPSAGNDWGKATVNITQVGTFKKAPYKFKLTPLLLVEPIVKLGAGVGKI